MFVGTGGHEGFQIMRSLHDCGRELKTGESRGVSVNIRIRSMEGGGQVRIFRRDVFNSHEVRST